MSIVRKGRPGYERLPRKPANGQRHATERHKTKKTRTALASPRRSTSNAVASAPSGHAARARARRSGSDSPLGPARSHGWVRDPQPIRSQQAWASTQRQRFPSAYSASQPRASSGSGEHIDGATSPARLRCAPRMSCVVRPPPCASGLPRNVPSRKSVGLFRGGRRDSAMFASRAVVGEQALLVRPTRAVRFSSVSYQLT